MSQKNYNLAIIGGGPAGLIAAGRAAELGSKVILIEKNERLGKKLLITGKGRCNITNAEPDLKKLINSYGKNGKFLYPAFNNLSNLKTIEFFEKKNLKTKLERGQRVFPFYDKSLDVLNCLEKDLIKNKVEIKLNSKVKKLITKNGKIEKIILESGKEIIAENFLIATGGKSYPETGSTGDAYNWLKELGHTIIKPKPVLTPILLKENFIKELEGLSLKNVTVSLWQTKKITELFGEALFTYKGLSGPVILNLSKTISDLKNLKNLKIKIDFKPALDYKTLDQRLLRDFSEQKNKQFKNCLNKLLPKKLIPIVIKLSKINPEKKINEITKTERKNLIKLFKKFELTFKELAGFEKAIITSGGVNLKEIDPKTLKSKIVKNLYFAGEILDLDGPTGGYNLQVAWSTGYLAGETKK